MNVNLEKISNCRSYVSIQSIAIIIKKTCRHFFSLIFRYKKYDGWTGVLHEWDKFTGAYSSLSNRYYKPK